MTDATHENPRNDASDGVFTGRRILVQAGGEVTVAMTEAATRFITPLTFQALSGRPVFTSQWDQFDQADPQHVRMAEGLDAALVAPCTMNTLARLAAGFTDDAVTTALSAIDRTRVPVLLAPSMNAEMWSQPATRRTLGILSDDGFGLIEPGSGWQACRRVGSGRLPEPEALITALADSIN